MGAAINYAAPKLIASGATFAQLKAGGFGAILDLLVTANPAITTPATAPTVAVTGGGSTGGLLAAGVYFVSYAWDTGAGRTAAIEVVSSFTVAAGNIPTVTIPALPTGVASAAIYLTAAGGATGTEVLYGVATGTTFNLAVAAYADPLDKPVTVNGTALSGLQPRINTPRARQAQMLFESYLDELSAFLRGDPMPQAGALMRLRHFATILHALAQAADDSASLCHANTGTLTTTTSALKSGPTAVRTFP